MELAPKCSPLISEITKSRLEMYLVPDIPPTLDDVLEKFKQEQAGKEGGVELLIKIMEAMQGFINGNQQDDSTVYEKFFKFHNYYKDEFSNAFVEYMGLTFYWHTNNKNEYAWHYYAKAQYYLGLYEALPAELERLEYLRGIKERQSEGRKQSNQEKRQKLVDALIKAAEKPAESKGWRSRKDLIQHAIPLLKVVIEREKLEKFQRIENLEGAVYKYLRNSDEAFSAYIKNAAPDNKDVLKLARAKSSRDLEVALFSRSAPGSGG